jgi:NADH-quinone oxidoreductase subunit J
MNFVVLAAESLTWQKVLACRTCWAIVLGAIALGVLIPRRIPKGQVIGGVLAIIAMGLWGSDLPLLRDWMAQGTFWVLAAVALGSGIGTISAPSPVHAALWFAMSLLGTAGLFFLQGSQFLGVATIVVYAGAIVVTFLFVIMLAQPEGHATYDRISWGLLPKVISVLSAAVMVGVLTMLLSGIREQALSASAPVTDATRDVTAAGEPVVAPAQPINPVLEPSQHMAGLGGYLFSRHLLSVELAGTLLLAALVGAVAIAIQGSRRSKIEEALR